MKNLIDGVETNPNGYEVIKLSSIHVLIVMVCKWLNYYNRSVKLSKTIST